ncbi:MAG: hypothetical protein ACRC2K_03895 [Clostridium sp.]
MKFKNIKNNYVMIIVAILAISFIMNIYVSWDNISYKYRVGKASYLNTEDIRTKNKSNIDILENSIKLGSINNEELLLLYRNYNSMSSDIIQLSNDYNFHKSKSISVFSKGSIKGDQVLKNEVYAKIQEFVLQVLNTNMADGVYATKIEGNLEIDFKVLLDLAENLESFYDEFGIKVLHSVKDEDKEKKIIKEHYWIDILENIDKLSAEYRDYEFQSVKAKMMKTVN